MPTRGELPPPADAGLFGADTRVADADVVVVGVPWEPTVSYGRGTSAAPAAIAAASHQLDVYDPFLDADFDEQAALAPLREDWIALNAHACRDASAILAARARLTPELGAKLAGVNRASERLNRELEEEVSRLLAAGKSVGVFGGDHSSPLGAMLAQLAHHGSCGVLHIDAHFDLREAYEGFTHSHASIMYNLLAASDQVEALVPVAIRDYSREEAALAAERAEITPFLARDLARARFAGRPWRDLCAEIVAALPERVYVSFDIDGLDPRLCPHTGTPVPGGLAFEEAVHLLESVVASKRRIIGFDLVEVAPDLERPHDEWDLNVGARLLHKLCALTWMSRRA
ncbi:MAG: arginase family protein [Myxococcales bacterium]|nr:arginase family protein [Myxococcales bacterium]MDH5308241.1 arginase family protein [Myxococcales bacterium]